VTAPGRRPTRFATAAPGPHLPRLRIGGLGLVTIVAYGVAYYSYGALIDPIKASTGWSSTGPGAAFSAVLVLGGAGGLFGGRLVDRLGTRPAFLIAATLGAGALAAASLAHTLLAFAALYGAGAGAIAALGFYHITQPAAIRSAPDTPERAVVWLTILGALASPIFLPLTVWLVHELGWRGTLRIDALIAAFVFVICATLRTTTGTSQVIPGEGPTDVRRALTDAWRAPAVRRWVLATMISGVAVDVVLVYQMPVMIAVGLPVGVAATIGGLRVVAQVGGRLPLTPLLHSIGTKASLVTALIVAFAAVLLLLASRHLAPPIGYGLLGGASIGALYTLQGIYTNEVVGTRTSVSLCTLWSIKHEWVLMQ